MDPLQAQLQNQLLVQALQGPKPATQAAPPNYMNQMGQPPGMLGARPPGMMQMQGPTPPPPATQMPGGMPMGQNMQGMGQQPQMTPALQKLLAGTL